MIKGVGPLQRENRAAGTPAGAGPRSAEEDDALSAELAEFEGLSAAQRLERFAEAEIITLLQLQQFDPRSPEWVVVARALAEYGYAVFCAWLATGMARSIAANHFGGRGVIGVGKLPESFRLADDDAHALSAELMMVSVESFRSKTLTNPNTTWRPNGGASLKTYFVGRCLMELPDAFERWRRAERSTAADIDSLPDDGRTSNDPANHAVVLAQLAEIDPVTLRMFELQEQSYSLTEIAELLTAAGHRHTEGSVRTRMSRARAEARGRAS